MSAIKINKDNTDQLHWGNNCNAWMLLNSQQLLIKEELMPAKTEEV